MTLRVKADFNKAKFIMLTGLLTPRSLRSTWLLLSTKYAIYDYSDLLTSPGYSESGTSINFKAVVVDSFGIACSSYREPGAQGRRVCGAAIDIEIKC